MGAKNRYISAKSTVTEMGSKKEGNGRDAQLSNLSYLINRSLKISILLYSYLIVYNCTDEYSIMFTDMLIPLNSSLYVAGKVTEPEKVIVELGTG